MQETTKFSVSDANLYKLCPRRFFYNKVEGYDVAELPNHLLLGVSYDKLLEILDQKGIVEARLQIANLFQDSHEAAEAEVILDHYVALTGDDPLPPVEGGNQHGFGISINNVKITGYLDKLSLVNKGGVEQCVVVERKTTSESIEPNSAYWERLDLDPQIRCYVWYLRQKGLKAGWVAYEVIRKLSSSYSPKLTKKKDIPIDEYRSLLASLNYNKTLVARRWIYVDEDMTQEFENEHQSVFAMFDGARKTTAQAYKDGHSQDDVITVWPKHEQSCDSYGGCPFKPICKKQTSFQNPIFTKKEGRFSCSI